MALKVKVSRKRGRAMPIRVDFQNNVWDAKLKRLAPHFNRKAIARATGLTDGQVQYRVTIGNLSNRNYRNGTSPEALELIARIDLALGEARRLRKSIRLLSNGKVTRYA